MRQPTAKGIAIGARIRVAREQKGYSQDELAAKLGVTKGLVSQYEGGITMPPSKRFSRLAEVLSVSEGWLLTGDDPDETNTAQTKAEQLSLHIFRSIPMEHQAAAHAILAAFAANMTKKNKKE